MADSHFATLVSATRNANTLANPMFVQSSNGSGAGLNPGVGATDLGKAEDAVHSSGDTGVMLLGVRQDTQVDFGADGDYVPLSIDENGAVRVSFVASGASGDVHVDDSAFAIGTDVVNGSGFLADETAPDSVDEGDIGLARMTLDRKILVRIVGAADANRWDVDASGLGQVDVAAHALTNANAVPISKDNSANSETNPIFVKTVETVISGEEVQDYDTTASVASDASDNHDYTVAGTTFLLTSIIFSSSGGGKVELQVGPIASLVSKAVAFVPKHGGTVQLDFKPAIEVPATGTGTIRLIRTNREGSAQDVYSSIIGNDV